MSDPAAGNIMNNPQTAFNNTMGEFSSPQAVDTTNQSFLDSNGIIAKLVFLIMVVIVFILLFYLILNLIGYFTSSSRNPMLINGQIYGNKYMSISQNPANASSKTILRSNNRATGIEFTWSVWLNYEDSTDEDKYSPVFVKGDISAPSSEYCSINNGPGVYFGKYDEDGSNTLYILMDTASESAVEINNPVSIIEIPNLPISTYFHLAIRCQNTYIDIYINGTLVKRQNLMNVPKQNYYNVNVCPCGGFSGTLSNLQYFDEALSVVEIGTIVQSGPNQKEITTNPFSPIIPNTISTSWYNSFLL